MNPGALFLLKLRLSKWKKTIRIVILPLNKENVINEKLLN